MMMLTDPSPSGEARWGWGRNVAMIGQTNPYILRNKVTTHVGTEGQRQRGTKKQEAKRQIDKMSLCLCA